MAMKLQGGGSNPIFSQDTPKFGFGDGKVGKDGKKVYEKRGKQCFYFNNRKFPISSHDPPKFGFGDGKNVKKWEKIYGKRGNKYSF